MHILNIMQGTHIGGTEKSSLTLMTHIKEFGNELFQIAFEKDDIEKHFAILKETLTPEIFGK